MTHDHNYLLNKISQVIIEGYLAAFCPITFGTYFGQAYLLVGFFGRSLPPQIIANAGNGRKSKLTEFYTAISISRNSGALRNTSFYTPLKVEFHAGHSKERDHVLSVNNQCYKKMKFSIKDFFGKCDQTRSFSRIWQQLLKKSLIENFIFCVAQLARAK